MRKRLNEEYSEVWKLFFESSTDVPALLPSAMLPRQAEGTRKKPTKPILQLVLSLNIPLMICRFGGLRPFGVVHHPAWAVAVGSYSSDLPAARTPQT